MTIFLLDKTDKSKKVYKKQGILYLDKNFVTARRYNHYEHSVPTAPKYMKEQLIELKWEIDSFIIIFEDFMIPLSIMDRKTRQRNNEDIQVLNSTANQFDLKDLQRTSPNNSRVRILLMCVWNIFLDSSYDRPQNKLVSLKRLKSCKVPFVNTMEWN